MKTRITRSRLIFERDRKRGNNEVLKENWKTVRKKESKWWETIKK